MATPYGAEYDDFPQWKKWVEQQLRKALSQAATRPQLQVSSGGFDVINDGAVRIFGTGGLKLTSSAGVPTFEVAGWAGGYSQPNGEPQPIIKMNRNDGSVTFFQGDVLPQSNGYQQFFAWYDRQGTIIFGDDTTSGRGLARPYGCFSITKSSDTVLMPNSAVFAESHLIGGYVQNPRMAVSVGVVSPSTGAAEVRIVHNDTGAVVAGPTTIPINSNIATFYEFDVPSSVEMFSYNYFSVQTRISSGSGGVSIRVFSAHGMQS